MAQVSLYVNSEDVTGAWDTVGSIPYLDAQDQPTNYIHSTSRNADSGTYGFETTTETGTINWVRLYIYAQGVASSNFATLLNGNDVGLGPPTSWGWVYVDVSSILTSWSLINAATVLFDRPNTTNEAGVDCAYLLVDYTGATVNYQSVYGSFDFAGDAARLPNKMLGGSLDSSGDVQRFAKKILSGSLDSVGTILKKVPKLLVGAFDFSGIVTAAKTFFQSVAGAFSFSGTLTRKTTKTLAGVLSFIGNLTKQLKGAGTSGFVGGLVRLPKKQLAGSLTSSGFILRKTSKLLTGTLNQLGILTKKSFKILAGTLTSTGSILRKTFKTLTGTLTSAGDLLAHKIGGLIQKTVGGVLTFTGNLQGSKLGEALSAIYQIIFRRRRRK